MTFWQRRVDDSVIEVISEYLKRGVDPMTELSIAGPSRVTLGDLRGIQKAIEQKLRVELPLFASDTWKTVGEIQASARLAVLHDMTRAA